MAMKKGGAGGLLALGALVLALIFGAVSWTFLKSGDNGGAIAFAVFGVLAIVGAMKLFNGSRLS